MGVQLLVIVSIAVHVFVTSSSADDITFCVVPEHVRKEVDTLHASYGTEQCTETKTWNEYLAQQYRYFNEVSNITFLFRHGTHYMNRSLEAKNVSSLRLSGSSPHDVILTAALLGESTPLIFSNFFDVTVEGMNMELCASIREDQYIQNGLIYFSNGANGTVQNVKLENTCNGSEIYGERMVDMSFIHLNVTKSKESFCGSLCLYPELSGTVYVINSTFRMMPRGACHGSGIFAFLNFGRLLMYNTSVFLYNCTFRCENVVFINLASTSSLSMDNVRTEVLGCDSNYVNICSINKRPLGVSRVAGTNGVLTIVNSTFRGCLSTAFVVTKVFVFIHDSVFDYNIDISPLKLTASALSIHDVSNGTLSNVRFNFNGIPFPMSVIPNSAALLVRTSSIHIRDCNFSASIGHALYSYVSNLYFSGHNRFSSNYGYEGCAMYLYDSNIQSLEGSISFNSNYAIYTGGAIQIAGVDSDNPVCPFHSVPVENGLSDTKRLKFIQNSADVAGNDIYGGYLDQALANEGTGNTTRCIEVIRQLSKLPNTLSSISSKPSRVCLCNSKHEPDCLEVFSSREAYPGEDITISAVAVGQAFGTSAGFIHAQLLSGWGSGSGSSSLDNEQHYQNVNQVSCNNLTYTISAQLDFEPTVLVLTATSELIQNYLSHEEVHDSIEQYNKNNRSFVPKSLLNFPVYINITFKPCPSGFNLSSDSSPICVCIPRLLQIDGVNCHISKKQLERSGTVWIGNTEHNSSSNRSAVLFSRYCPNNYCNPAMVNIFTSSDLQCQNGHSGRLCGECPNGMSLTLGISQCKDCSNENLYLVALFAIGGVVLVIFIKVTDLTTAGGLINGLILYANFVKASGYVYFTANSSTTYLKFCRVFIDWVNLDFGIETCFFNGLNGYWKTWLQFVFPIYIWTIALSMILMARYSIKMSHLLGNNTVPVLATLFTLSYAKLFRVIITAIQYTVLEDAESNNTMTVWSYDGGIGYFDARHSILLLVAVLVLLFLWLPYTCVLLFVQCLHLSGIRTISRFVSRMQPFLDAHCGPFKIRHRYWFGLLLVGRAILLWSLQPHKQ